MKIEKIVTRQQRTNCYIISHHEKAIIIDPGADLEVIQALLQRDQLSLEAIFITHGHFDHIGAVDGLYQAYGCPIYMHHEDAPIVLYPENYFDASMPLVKIKSPITYFDGDFSTFVILDDVTLDAVHTPGHSQGSVVYVLRDYERLFSGDTLFREGIGRCDFKTSNRKDLKESLKLLKTFKDSCKVFPGHGNETTIGYEKENNLYF